MRSLAVYEPPYTGDDHPGPEFGQHLDELVAARRRDQAAEQWLGMTGTPPTIVESIKRSPGWAHRQALAHTLSQDLRLTNNGEVPIERLKRIEAPVLAMAGAASPPWAASTSANLAGVLPHASEQIVDGQHHVPADHVVAAILEASSGSRPVRGRLGANAAIAECRRVVRACASGALPRCTTRVSALMSVTRHRSHQPCFAVHSAFCPWFAGARPC